MRSEAAARRRLLLCLLPAVLAAACAADDPDSVVDLDTARAELAAGRALLVDIREPAEHAGGVAPGARLIPMRHLAAGLAQAQADRGRTVLLICQTQNRSSAAMRALRERGITDVRYVKGGMSEWTRRGWPLVRPGPFSASPG
ncbi:MAG: rhodanese-like domain-containing protein [Burkholderiales bacterium]|nr:rhodanese-like domain-containing protein [Burkholderiales bacterium]